MCPLEICSPLDVNIVPWTLQGGPLDVKCGPLDVKCVPWTLNVVPWTLNSCCVTRKGPPPIYQSQLIIMCSTQGVPRAIIRSDRFSGVSGF
jgi:hypothetical protein